VREAEALTLTRAERWGWCLRDAPVAGKPGLRFSLTGSGANRHCKAHYIGLQSAVKHGVIAYDCLTA
jgi:hypothetical protein